MTVASVLDSWIACRKQSPKAASVYFASRTREAVRRFFAPDRTASRRMLRSVRFNFLDGELG